jgi:hypothetical protein
MLLSIPNHLAFVNEIQKRLRDGFGGAGGPWDQL